LFVRGKKGVILEEGCVFIKGEDLVNYFLCVSEVRSGRGGEGGIGHDVEDIVKCVFAGTFRVKGEDSVESVNGVGGKRGEFEAIGQIIEDDGEGVCSLTWLRGL
jgi:hypothetical protein